MFKYFAYGSNMSLSRIKARVPSAHKVGMYALAQHQLCFHKHSEDGSGKCDAFFTGNQEHVVYGALFDIDKPGKRFLDQVEGVGFGYEIKSVIVKDLSGHQQEAFIYYATRITSGLKPYHWYLNHVTVGARETGVPQDYLEIIQGVESVRDPFQERESREFALHSKPVYPSE